MGAKQSKNSVENEFVFENPLLQTQTFELPKKDVDNNNEIPADTNNNENADNNPIEDNNSNNLDNEVNSEVNPDVKTETNESNDGNVKNNESNDINNEFKEVKKDKKKKYIEEPIPSDDDSYKPLELIKPDEILSPEAIESIIEEHVKEEVHRIKNDNKVLNFKRDKLLERTINTIKYGSSNYNIKDINDKYRKSQKKVLECLSNNSQSTLSERDIACYQEFEEFKDNIRMLYKKYYNSQ